MAKFGRFLDAEVTVNSVDISAFVRSVTLDINTEKLDQTAMGDTTKVWTQGFSDWTVTLELYQSYYTAEIDATLYPLWSGNTAFTVTVMPNATAGVGTENPKYTGSGRIYTYTPVGGSHGDILMTTVEIASAGAITRATA